MKKSMNAESTLQSNGSQMLQENSPKKRRRRRDKL